MEPCTELAAEAKFLVALFLVSLKLPTGAKAPSPSCHLILSLLFLGLPL